MTNIDKLIKFIRILESPKSKLNLVGSKNILRIEADKKKS